MNHELTNRLLTPNPFSTHRVRPGRLRFQFPEGQSVHRILSSLRANQWRGQIVGPHGSGKTTLLHTLGDVWPDYRRKVISVSLRNQEPRLPPIDWESLDRNTQLIVDGYEQLRWIGRWWLRQRCRSRRCGLLVTTHTCVAGMPVVYRTAATLNLVSDLCAQLTEVVLPPACVAACFSQAKGSVRETFMLLYDAFEESAAAGQWENGKQF